MSLSPTRKRYWVIVFAVTLAILSYIDRVTLSKVAPQITQDLGLTKQQMGFVFSAFALAYALFEIPGGWMGDWLGPRRVLMRIVIWWSACTALMGAVWNHASMVVLQFLFGAGEAGGFPNLTKAMTVWLPRGERVRAQGIMWMFARWGGAFTPLLVYYVSQVLHSWRLTFVLFGSLGAIWAVAFYLWFRDDPRQRKDLNDAEQALLAENAGNAGGHANVPWAAALRSRSVWLLWAQYFCLTYPWYFYITWLPTYLARAPPPDGCRRGAVRHPPLVPRRGWLPVFRLGLEVRRQLGRECRADPQGDRDQRLCGRCGICWCCRTRWSIRSAAILLIGFASFCNDLVMPHAWATCHGCRRQVRRDAFRLDEHDGESRRGGGALADAFDSQPYRKLGHGDLLHGIHVRRRQLYLAIYAAH